MFLESTIFTSRHKTILIMMSQATCFWYRHYQPYKAIKTRKIRKKVKTQIIEAAGNGRTGKGIHLLSLILIHSYCCTMCMSCGRD